MRLQGAGPTNRIFTVEASSDLAHWAPIAVLDGRTRNPETGEVKSTNSALVFVDPAASTFPMRFYRFSHGPIGETNDWKNQALFVEDAFASDPGSQGAGDGVRWLKFAIVLSEPARVYYQDSRKYLLHYDFAAARLDPFKGLNRAAFDQVSLFATNQQVQLGTILFPPDAATHEYAIQFAGRDPWPATAVQHFFDLVRASVLAPPDAVAFYFPSYEQAQLTTLNADFFRTNGIRVSSINRWLRGDQVYANGWALGRVKFITAGEINTAYLDGRLQPSDILLTDGVPAEVPFVAGIISLVPATPNSHVAILAGSYGVPFVYLSDPGTQAQAQQKTNRLVVLQAVNRDGFGQVQLIDVENTLGPQLQSELLALKAPPQPQIIPKARFGAFSAPTDPLTPDDICYFGGKAANYGLLRRVIPSNSEPAMAFSFDLWDAFMDQALASGKTLRAEISERLRPYTYPPNMAALSLDLDAIRQLITKTAHFNAAQRAQVLSALAGFDPQRNIRFRSSSNAEDSQSFTAAGLYDSYSGCLADDLDPDTDGSCRCDPAESQERGVFRAIQKVYASFYNNNAFLERLRRGLDESQLAMGLLVHYSTPDEFELANGVAIVWTDVPRFGDPQLNANLVTQLGAVSVTNPEGNAKPEIVSATPGGVSLQQSSSLVPFGAYVMDWTADYDALAQLLRTVYGSYRGPGGVAPTRAPILNFEYKKAAPGQLMVKQVRPLPLATTNLPPTYLLNQPTTYWVYQSEGSDALANHRLKCFLTLENTNLRLDATNLDRCFYTSSTFQCRSGTNLLSLSGQMTDWPGASHSTTTNLTQGNVIQDRWIMGQGIDQLQFQLTSVLPPVTPSDPPFIPQADIRKWLDVTYATPAPGIGGRGTALITNEQVQLIASPAIEALQAGTVDSFSVTNNARRLEFQVSFLTSTNAPGPPLGVDKNMWGAYPAALSPWMHSRITGLTTEALQLSGYWSQSARAGHKYRYAWYVFEPQLEPGLTASQIAELRASNIQLIHVERETWPGGEITVTLLDFDGKFRPWAEE